MLGNFLINCVIFIFYECYDSLSNTTCKTSIYIYIYIFYLWVVILYFDCLHLKFELTG